MSKILNYLRLHMGKQTRKLRNRFERRRYNRIKSDANENFSVISQNCIGTLMCHDLGLKFRSPTVNLYMDADNFIRFCENLEYYLSLDAETIRFFPDDTRTYPVGILEDVKMYFVHYKSPEDVIACWNRRRERVNKNNLVFIMTDRDGCDSGIMRRFLSLPYKNKIFFSSKNVSHPSVCYMPCFSKEKEVGGLTDYCSVFGKRYYAKYFDYISWLAQENS